MKLRRQVRRKKVPASAFSIIEFMISAAILAGIVAGSLAIIGSLKRKQNAESLRSELSLRSSQISQIIDRELDSAVMISGDSNLGTHFGSEVVFGILRNPDQDPGSSTTDGMQLMVLDTDSSVQSTYVLKDLSISGGTSTITLTGDFRPTDSIIEDLFVIKNDDRTEIFQVNGNITYNGVDDESVFDVEQDASEFLNNVLSPEVYGEGSVFRVRRKIFQIGNGGSLSTGLFMLSNGKTIAIATEAISMQVYYLLSSRDGTATADCQSKTNTRYFVHAVNATDCDWNDIQSLRIEVVLASKSSSESTETENPHTGEYDKKVKVLGTIVHTPLNYNSNP